MNGSQDLTNVPPPGYVQSLISKIISNVKIVCNNLILKYVEDDIVLSLNTRWLCLSPANALWEPAFVESLSLPDLVLRKKLEVKDMTVCLDKRDASGRINIYQEPFCKFFSSTLFAWGSMILSYNNFVTVKGIAQYIIMCRGSPPLVTDIFILDS